MSFIFSNKLDSFENIKENIDKHDWSSFTWNMIVELKFSSVWKFKQQFNC